MVTAVFVARIIGPTRLGYYNLVMYVTMITSSLGSLGIPLTTFKYMGEFLGAGKKEFARAVFFYSLRAQTVIASILSAAGMIAHMNADHADAMVLYCQAFSRATAITSARMTGIDRYGFEMSANTAEGPRPIRLAFAKPVTTPEEARFALVAMVKDARSKLS